VAPSINPEIIIDLTMAMHRKYLSKGANTMKRKDVGSKKIERKAVRKGRICWKGWK